MHPHSLGIVTREVGLTQHKERGICGSEMFTSLQREGHILSEWQD